MLVGLGTQLNPNESQLKNFPGTGTAIAGRAQLAAAGISPGVMKPLDVLVENGGNAQAIAAKLAHRRRASSARARLPAWHRGQDSLVEAFPAIDGSAPGIQGIIDRAKNALEGHQRDGHRRRRGRPRLRARDLRDASPTCSRSW